MIKLALALICCFPFFSIAESLFSTDFATADSYQALPEGNPAHITGTLPKGVLEDSGWAKIKIDYQHQKNPLGGELGWLHVRLQGGERGQGQLKWALPPLDKPAAYRLRLKSASPDNASITFAIRDDGPPWKAYWEKTVAPSGFMDEQVFDFNLPALEGSKNLIAHMGARGTFLIESVELIRRDEAELKKEQERLLATAPDNLLPTTGFPLGLPPLWSNGTVASYTRDILVEAASEPSERGTVPLRLASRSERSVTLYSAPFEPLVRNAEHCLSFYIRGNISDGSASILVNKKALVSKILFTRNGEWTRISLPFTPDLMAPFHVLKIELKGDVEIDSLMLNLGTEPKPFSLQKQAEVALSVDPLKNHVIVEGVDPDLFSLAVTGAPKDAEVELHVINFFGERQTLPPQQLSGEPVEQFSVSLAEVFPQAPYGPFRVEARVKQDGQEISPPADMVLYRLREPRFWGREGKASYFGGHIHDHEPHLYSAKAIGQNWNRLHGGNGGWVYWSGVEPQKGQWTFHEERLQAIRGAGLNIVGSWLHCPGWARIERQSGKGWLDNWWQPRDLDEYTHYIKVVTQAYKPYIQHWQIWNEPWGEFWFKEWRPELGPQHQWHAGPDPEGDYARLSEKAYTAGKAAMPDVTIIGVNSTIGDRGKNWMEQMIKRDVEKNADVIAFHAYSGGQLAQQLSDKPEHLKGRIEKRILEPLIQKYGTSENQELWLTEGNVLSGKSHSGGGMYKYSYTGDRDPQKIIEADSQLFSAYHLICFSLGVDKVFSYAQSAVEQYFNEKNGLYWGALGLNGGELNPSAAVYAATAWHIDQAAFTQRLLLGDVHTFVFQRGDTAVAALITDKPLANAWTPPADDSLIWRDCLANNAQGPFTFSTIVWVERQGPAGELETTLQSLLP